MSSFWNRRTGADEEKQTPDAADEAAQNASITGAGGVKPAFGIAQANDLMAKLAMGDNADVVIRVVRKTLESVGVKIHELIAEAKNREGDLRTKIAQHRSTIEELAHKIDAERKAITGAESELAVTSRTRSGLERSEANGPQVPRPPGTAPSASPAEPTSPPRAPKPFDKK